VDGTRDRAILASRGWVERHLNGDEGRTGESARELERGHTCHQSAMAGFAVTDGWASWFENS
jgi:hypothetical protein